MKKYTILAFIVFIGFTGSVHAQTAPVFQCPSDWNCFPKTITACPIGYTCIRNSDGFKIGEIETKAADIVIQPIGIIPQNEISKLNTKISGLYSQYYSLIDQENALLKQYDDCMSGYCYIHSSVNVTVNRMKQQTSNYECQINNFMAQLSNLESGQATSTALQTLCNL